MGPQTLCKVVFVCLLAEVSAAFVKFKKINNKTYLWWELKGVRICEVSREPGIEWLYICAHPIPQILGNPNHGHSRGEKAFLPKWSFVI